MNIVRHYNVFTKEEISKFTTTDYLAGYTQAEQVLSSQLTAYKEALNKCITQLKVCRDLLGHEADFIMDLTTTIVEVKFLLNPPCEDVDKKE